MFDKWKDILNDSSRALSLGFSRLFNRNGRTPWRTPVFSSQHQIRVLLFRECDWRGRKLLFDSKTIKKKDRSTTKNDGGATKSPRKTDELLNFPSTNSPRNVGKVDVKNAISYEYLKPSPDFKMLGEMIFGSVAMSFCGSTLKIHTIRSPPQLMISFVFPTPLPSNQRLRDFDNSGSLQNSISEHLIPNPQDKFDSSSSVTSCMAHSVPVDVPGRFNVSSKDTSYNSADSLNSTTSNCSAGNSSVVFSVDSQNSSLTRSSSYNSFQRRWLRNLSTNIECGLRRRSDELSFLDESKISGQRRVKLGLSVIVSLGDNTRDENDFRDFFFSHITLIEGHVTKLVDTVSKAYLNSNKDQFVHLVFEGVETLRSSIQDLFMTPRLSNPMWLSLVAPSSNHHQQCRKFMGEFLTLIRLYDTKQTHFFVSTLLTAILTNHLAWVSTVTPTENNPIHNFHKKEAAFWLDQLAKSHPYNPLWMQLGDLYGAVGFPCKISRTIVLGKKAETILRFLQVLSYFIRCSDVFEKIQEGGVNCDALKEALKSPLNEPSTLNPAAAVQVPAEKWVENKEEGLVASKGLAPSEVTFLLGDSPVSRKFEQSSSDDENKRNYKDTSGAESRADSLGYGSYGNTLDIDLQETNRAQEDSRWCTNHDRINLNDFVLETVPEVKFDESLDENRSVSNTPTLKNLPESEVFDKNNQILSPDDLNLNEFALETGHHEVKFESLIDENRSVSNTPTLKNLPESEVFDKNNQILSPDDLNLNEFALETGHESLIDKNRSVSNTPTSKILPPGCEDKDDISSPDDLNRTKLYIQEYRMLRFNNNNNTSSRDSTPVPSSPENKGIEVEATALETNMVKEESEAPEEGYQSMDDGQTSAKGLGNMIENLFSRIPPATTEYNLPKIQTKDISEAPSVSSGFGWSLFASLTDKFLPDFCLQGLLGTVSEESIYEDLSASVHTSVLGEPVASAVCILADVDNWSVKICSSSGSVLGNKKFSTCMSPLVAGICDSLLQMSQLNMSAEFCLMHLEDRLQELFFRSQSLACILNEESDLLPQNALEKAVNSLAIDTNDIPLLISIATTHSPQLASFNR